MTPADLFHREFYDAGLWHTSFMDVPMQKYPNDLWMYQKILWEKRPELVVECGTCDGGTTLFLATMLKAFGLSGQVVSIDIEDKPNRPKHERITYLLGSSTSIEVVLRVRGLAQGSRTMVILDSNHTKAHVLTELTVYAPIVTSGQYMIVEDTNLNGHPVLPNYGPGPMEAVEEFLKTNQEFVINRAYEQFIISANPRGYLMKK
jgi:cephalosporin hydroxylase